MIKVLEEVDSKVVIETLFGMRTRVANSANECDIGLEEIDNMLNILTSDVLEDIFNGMSLSFSTTFKRITRDSIVRVDNVELDNDFFLFSVKGKNLAVQMSGDLSKYLIDKYVHEYGKEDYLNAKVYVVTKLLTEMFKEYFITFNNECEVKDSNSAKYERTISFMVGNNEKSIINICI